MSPRGRGVIAPSSRAVRMGRLPRQEHVHGPGMRGDRVIAYFTSTSPAEMLLAATRLRWDTASRTRAL